MTHVDDSMLGKISRQQNDLFRRVREGSLDPGFVSRALQQVIEGRLAVSQTITPTPFNPEEFLGKGWTIEEEDERSLSLSELDLSKVTFETTLREGEERVNGEERLGRLKEAGVIRLDARFFLTLWKNQHLIPESWKEKTNGNTTFIFFDGTILRRPSGSRSVLYLCWRGGQWLWDYSWLDNDWDAYAPSAVLAS